MKKLASISFIILLISVTIIASYALGEASVQSSEVFRSASLSAASTGTVTFSATIKNKGDVSVTTCSLERLSEGNWVLVKSLPVSNVFFQWRKLFSNIQHYCLLSSMQQMQTVTPLCSNRSKIKRKEVIPLEYDRAALRRKSLQSSAEYTHHSCLAIYKYMAILP